MRLGQWRHRISIKHLFTELEDHASIQASMNAIADVLCDDSHFSDFSALKQFRNIPIGDDIMDPVDYANKLMDKLYDYGDSRRIWIG